MFFLFQKVRIINDEYSYSGRFDRDGKALATGDEETNSMLLS